MRTATTLWWGQGYRGGGRGIVTLFNSWCSTYPRNDRGIAPCKRNGPQYVPNKEIRPQTDIAELLDQLARLLEHGDYSATRLVSEQRDRLMRALGGQLPAIESAIAQFDFESALRRLEAARDTAD